MNKNRCKTSDIEYIRECVRRGELTSEDGRKMIDEIQDRRRANADGDGSTRAPDDANDGGDSAGADG